jgi:hypothetical protein
MLMEALGPWDPHMFKKKLEEHLKSPALGTLDENKLPTLPPKPANIIFHLGLWLPGV